MGQLVDEVRTWNTPLIGAYLIWRFVDGYHKAHVHGDAPIGLLAFVAMAILTNKDLSAPINNHRKSLQSYALCFENDRKTDLLVSIHERIKSKMQYTLDAIDTATAKKLIVWFPADGKLYIGDDPDKIFKKKKSKPAIAKEGDKAEILGRWLAEHDIKTIASYLRLVF